MFNREITVNEDGEQTEKLNEIIGIDGTIAGDTINLIKITIPENLNGKLFVFPKSKLTFNANKLFIYGQTSAPRVRGDFVINDISIPEILLKADDLALNFKGQRLYFLVNNLMASSNVLYE